MKKLVIGGIALAIIGVIGIVMVFGMYVSYSNSEKRQRNLIVNKQKDNNSELDNMVKVISQVAEVTEEQTAALKDIIVGHAEARATKGGSLATFVREAVPNIDVSSKTFQNLQNHIVASRNSWTMRQKELLDMKREHDNMIDTFPSSMIVGGRGKIDVTIVTSSRTKEAFRTGEDNDTTLFKRNK